MAGSHSASVTAPARSPALAYGGALCAGGRECGRCTLFPYTTLFRSNLRRSAMGRRKRMRPRFAACAWMRSRIQAQAAKDRKSTRLNASHVEIAYAALWLQRKSWEGEGEDTSEVQECRLLVIRLLGGK